MNKTRVRPTSSISPVLYGGLAIMASALTWWLIYYAQWRGMFQLLEVKLSCISGDSAECNNFQDFIGPSFVPVYSPMLLWLGTMMTVLGLYLTRRNRA